MYEGLNSFPLAEREGTWLTQDLRHCNQSTHKSDAGFGLIEDRLKPQDYRVLSRSDRNLSLQRRHQTDLPVYLPSFGHNGRNKPAEERRAEGMTTTIDVLVNHKSRQVLAPGMRLELGLITRSAQSIPSPVALNNVCWDFPILEQEGCKRGSASEIACCHCGLPSYGSETVPLYWPPPPNLDLLEELPANQINRDRMLEKHRRDLAVQSKERGSKLFALRVFPATLLRISQTRDSGKKLMLSLASRGRLLHTRIQVQTVWPVRAVLGWEEKLPLDDSLIGREHYHVHDSSAKSVKLSTETSRRH